LLLAHFTRLDLHQLGFAPDQVVSEIPPRVRHCPHDGSFRGLDLVHDSKPLHGIIQGVFVVAENEIDVTLQCKEL
jgi:hypothetical protein